MKHTAYIAIGSNLGDRLKNISEALRLLEEHPLVKVVHAVGVAHPTRGEDVAAFVVRRDDSCSAEQLGEFCRQRLAAYKVPRHFFFCTESELPIFAAVSEGKSPFSSVEFWSSSPLW